MTRERFYGSDTEFCAWMRSCADLPSYSKDFGFVASDNDITIHRYMSCVDNIGTREVQGIMQIEVKTRLKIPESSQMDTLSKLNLFCGQKKKDGVDIRFFGVFILVMEGTTPDDSENMWWGVIPKGKVFSNAVKNIKSYQINKKMLIKIMRFDVHPRNLTPEPFRRHHKTSEIMVSKISPLGFEYDEKITKKS